MLTPCDESESDRRMNVTIYVQEWLLWAGIGVALMVGAIVGLGFYVPAWALWAWGLGLALVGMLFTGLAVWILSVVKSWLERERGAGPRKYGTGSGTHSTRIFPDL